MFKTQLKMKSIIELLWTFFTNILSHICFFPSLPFTLLPFTLLYFTLLYFTLLYFTSMTFSTNYESIWFIFCYSGWVQSNHWWSHSKVKYIISSYVVSCQIILSFVSIELKWIKSNHFELDQIRTDKRWNCFVPLQSPINII